MTGQFSNHHSKIDLSVMAFVFSAGSIISLFQNKTLSLNTHIEYSRGHGILINAEMFKEIP